MTTSTTCQHCKGTGNKPSGLQIKLGGELYNMEKKENNPSADEWVYDNGNFRVEVRHVANNPAFGWTVECCTSEGQRSHVGAGRTADDAAAAVTTSMMGDFGLITAVLGLGGQYI